MDSKGSKQSQMRDPGVVHEWTDRTTQASEGCQELCGGVRGCLGRAGGKLHVSALQTVLLAVDGFR